MRDIQANIKRNKSIKGQIRDCNEYAERKVVKTIRKIQNKTDINKRRYDKIFTISVKEKSTTYD